MRPLSDLFRQPSGPARRRHALVRRAAAFLRSSHGVAAVEFALVLPVMVTLYLGLVEVTQGVTADRKVTLVSRTVADLVGRTPTISRTEMDDILAAGLSVMAPNKSDGIAITVSSIYLRPSTSGGAARPEVCWSAANALGTRRPVGVTSEPVPDGFNTPGTSYILAEVRLPYKPVIGYTLTGTINLEQKTPWPVRSAPQVTYDSQRCS